MDPIVDLSVIFVSYNTLEMTKKALSDLFASVHNFKMKVYVVDNDSKDHSAEILRRECSNITLIENVTNVGFGRANNQALPYLDSRYVLLLNTDAFVALDAISKTIDYMDKNSKCGILGVKLLGRNGELQPSCRYFPTPWNIFLSRTGFYRFVKHIKMVDDMSWDHNSVRDCDWVPGCYYLIRKEVIDQVGLFDPRYFLYYEEIDHCFAAKAAGWKVTYFPFTSVVHIGGESAKSEGEITKSGRQIEALKIESEMLYFQKNYGVIGTLENLLLNSLTDFILTIKDVLRFKPLKVILSHFRRSMYMWMIFFRTKFATIPTR